MKEPRTFDFNQLIAEIWLALEDMSGEDVATHYNRLIDPEIEYIGDGLWKEKE